MTQIRMWKEQQLSSLLPVLQGESLHQYPASDMCNTHCVMCIVKNYKYIHPSLLDVEQAWTSVFYLKSFDMDSVQVGKAVFGKEIYTTLGIEPRTYS